jgi:preprotein translocase subunit Sec63
VGAANHYALLGLSPQATGPELRQAFRSLSKRYHPDTTELPRGQAEEAFQQLQQAYFILSDPARRRAYDASLEVPARPAVVRLEPRPVPVRRPLSGGEWFALVLLALAVLFSLVLGVGLAWARGAELVRPPSWWSTSVQTAQSTAVAPADVPPAASPDTALQPPPAGA